MGQTLSGFFKPIAGLRHVEPLGQDRMRLQAGVFADELGMKLVRRAYKKAVPRFFAGGQDENQPSKQICRLAPEHRFLEKRRLSFERFINPLKRVLPLDFSVHGTCAGHWMGDENLEARGGIEPPIKVLQTFALPLGDRASGAGCRRGDEPAEFMRQLHSIR